MSWKWSSRCVDDRTACSQNCTQFRTARGLFPSRGIFCMYVCMYTCSRSESVLFRSNLLLRFLPIIRDPARNLELGMLFWVHRTRVCTLPPQCCVYSTCSLRRKSARNTKHVAFHPPVSSILDRLLAKLVHVTRCVTEIPTSRIDENLKTCYSKSIHRKTGGRYFLQRSNLEISIFGSFPVYFDHISIQIHSNIYKITHAAM